MLKISKKYPSRDTVPLNFLTKNPFHNSTVLDSYGTIYWIWIQYQAFLVNPDPGLKNFTVFNLKNFEIRRLLQS